MIIFLIFFKLSARIFSEEQIAMELLKNTKAICFLQSEFFKNALEFFNNSITVCSSNKKLVHKLTNNKEITISLCLFHFAMHYTFGNFSGRNFVSE